MDKISSIQVMHFLVIQLTNGFLNPTINLKILFCTKVVDSEALVFHRLLIAAYSNVTVNHFCLKLTKTIRNTKNRGKIVVI